MAEVWNMDFKHDLKMWKWAELEFMDLLSYKKNVKSIERPQGKFPDYDVKSTNQNWTEFTWEVKWDWWYPSTKCLWIEYENKWVPSGILTSKADFYVFKLGAKFFYCKRAELLRLLFNTPDKWDKIGGDDWTSRLYIIPENLFYTIATEVKWED